MRLEQLWREEDGTRLAMALWRPGPGWTMISSGVLGGGLGRREWVLNAQVPGLYHRMDPATHLAQIARAIGLDGPGVGLLTAASVAGLVTATEAGAHAAATVGLRVPTWAAAARGAADPELAPIGQWQPGTINIVVSVPVPLTDAAFVNAVITATEAKSQAVIEAGFPGTGTASDAVCVAAPRRGPAGAVPQDFAGPRSLWGARIARAVHEAVLTGAKRYPAGPAPAG
jgi:adenosylcobinamide amidohydrolase